MKTNFSLHSRVLFLFLAASVFVGCGKKANPKSPEDIAPAPIENLLVSAEAQAINLSWTAPLFDNHGEPLLDLKSFVIRRGYAKKDELPRYLEIAHIDIGTPPEVSAVSGSAPVAVPPPATSPAPATGAPADPALAPQRYLYRDTAIQPGWKYYYIIVPVNIEDVEGMPSRTIRVTFIGQSSIVELL